MLTSRHFGGILLMIGRQKIINECVNGDSTSVMFTQTRHDWGKRKSTSGRNSSQVDPVPGKYGQLYIHTKC